MAAKNGWRTIYRTRDNKHIAFMNSQLSPEEKREYADLMSAAPDLLEALGRFVAFVDNVSTDQYESAMVRQARAAIKKAKGE